VTAEVLAADAVDEAVRLLGDGRLVAIPTDTVYGLAARLDDTGAVAALFDAKGRPDTVPVAVLCATLDAATALARAWPAAAAALAARFWPGPLTVVVDADPALEARLGSSRGVGLRVPNDAGCARLLAATGPLAVTSANRHGEPPATSAAAAHRALGDVVAAVLDGGVRDGVVSTVVDCTGSEPVVLREGALDAAAVRAAVS
jgi:tRNA threonylcarbamoyl adenosine modification protein (Sua5/YciO/YrdC/YwlC family)